jgi:hypothetical protein
MKSNKEKNFYPAPSDISERFYLQYDSMNDIKNNLVPALTKKIEDLLESSQLDIEDIRRLWFPEGTSTINVIGPPSQTKTEFAEITSSNYAYLHRFGDKDALLEILLLLSRLYPTTKIRKYMADDFDFHSDFLKEDIVVLGGPGGGHGDEGNRFTKLITERIGSRVSYSEDCENMYVKGSEIFSATYDNDGNTKSDYGYFARIPNPFNPSSTAILIHGIHTFGVLGSARAFSDDSLARKNIQYILDKIGMNPYFECCLRVDVIKGNTTIPEVNEVYHI